MTCKTGTVKLIRAGLAACLAATLFALLSACGDDDHRSSGGLPPDPGEDPVTGQVFWFNGDGVDSSRGNGWNWDRLDAGAAGDSYAVTSFAAQWTTYLGTDDNYFAWGLEDGSVKFGAPGGSPVTLWQGGASASVESLQARFNAPGSEPVQIVTGRQDGSIHYYNGEGTNNIGWSRLQDGGWGSPAKFLAVQWPDENTYNGKLRIVVGLEDSATEFYDGNGWRELHDAGWASETTSMSVYFSNEAYWPAVVQGLENGTVLYHQTSGAWTVLQEPGWSAVSKMKVQFPEENNQGYVKVVVGLADSSVQYYDGTGFQQLHDNGWQSSTNGLCAYFPTDNNSVNNIKVVTGLGDDAVLYWDDGGWSELLASRVEGKRSGVANMECSWIHGELEIVATYTNGPILYYNYSAYAENNSVGWTSLAPYDVGENQFSFFSANFDGTPLSGTPRVAGGYRPWPSDKNILKWLECKICSEAVGALVDDTLPECDAECAGIVEGLGLGPEDPVADFVALACIYICDEIESYIGDQAENDVCTAVHMCR